MTSIQVSTVEPKFKILQPVSTQPGNKINIYKRRLSVEQLEKYILTPASRSKLVALDLETQGISPFYPHVYQKEESPSRIVGVGLAWGSSTSPRSAYIDWTRQDDSLKIYFLKRIADFPLCVFNLMFESLWMTHEAKELGQSIDYNFVHDGYIHYKLLGSDGWFGQQWGLKSAQVNLLGWDEKGDVALDNWLIENGYYTESGKKGERKRSAVKGEMWRVPVDILGHYCALDCISTLQLIEDVLLPAAHNAGTHNTVAEEFVQLTKNLTKQQIDGMPVSVQLLDNIKHQFTQDLEKVDQSIYSLPEVTELLRERKVIDMTKDSKYWNRKWKDDETVWTKSGNMSKNYINWVKKVSDMWRAPTKLNFNSPQQMQWLVYEKLYNAKKKIEVIGKREVICYEVDSPRGKVLLPATDSGGKPINKQSFGWLGEIGQGLKKRSKIQKMLEYTESYLNLQVNGKLHPGWRVPRAVTGRLGGSSPNVQQLSKDPNVLRAFTADTDYVIVESDWSSLEDYVAANVTNCPGLLSLYGPDAKLNDGHLWLLSQLPGIQNSLEGTGYDRNNPTPESIKKAKEQCEKERSIAKKVKYSATYGIGAFKLWQDLMLDGIQMEREAVKELLEGYWDAFHGMKSYKKGLYYKWRKNRGWIYNAIGRKIPIADDKTKDLFSRAVQSGGHDINVIWSNTVEQAAELEGLRFKTYIADLHDARYDMVHKDDLERMTQIYHESAEKIWEWLQQEFGWTCRLKVDVGYGKTLADLKFGDKLKDMDLVEG